jgi:3-isopropylmalate dehydrogenase
MKIAVLPGDGIGPEIVRQAVKVHRTAEKADGLADRDERRRAIGGAGYEAAGDPLPDATLELARKASDAILLGAVGGPKFDTLDRPLRPEQGLLRIRKALEPVHEPASRDGLSRNSPTRRACGRKLVAGLDIMILRELTGDIYFGSPRGIVATLTKTTASAKASTR